MVGILIIMNNYLHDLATALLVISTGLLFVMARGVEERSSDEVIHFFIAAYEKLTYLAIGSLIWIILGGIVRTLAFRKYDWPNAVSKGIVPALIAKHIIIFTAVFIGLYFWVKLRKKVAKLQEMAGKTNE